MLIDFLLADFNTPFLWSLLALVLIGLLEVIGLLLAGGLSSVLEPLLPEIDFEEPGVFGKVLYFAHYGNLPLVVIIILWLMNFSIWGFVIQWVWQVQWGMGGGLLLPVCLALIASLIGFRYLGGQLAKLFASTETQATSNLDFIGKIAKVTLGKGTFDSPTQAKLVDSHGKTHYVMVRSFNENDSLEPQQTIIIVEKGAKFFRAVPAPADIKYST